jgi:hypothetical protein
MTTYLAIRHLAKGQQIIRSGSTTRLEWLTDEQRQKLVDIGVVRPLVSPPLAELKGWKTRATKLTSLGIETIEEFLEAEVGALTKTLRVRPATVSKWRNELAAWHQQAQVSAPDRK